MPLKSWYRRKTGSLRACMETSGRSVERADKVRGRRRKWATTARGPAPSVRDARDAEAQPEEHRGGANEIWAAVVHQRERTSGFVVDLPGRARDDSRSGAGLEVRHQAPVAHG